jgi:hypothetical protein
MADSHGNPPCGCATGQGLPTQSLPHKETHVHLHVNCLLLLSDFNQNWNHLQNYPVSNGMEICSVVLKLLHENGQTDTHTAKIRGTFLQLLVVTVPKNKNLITLIYV